MLQPDGSTFQKSYWAEVWARTQPKWEDRQSLVALAFIILALIGYGSMTADPKVALLVVGLSVVFLVLQMCVFTPMSMWRDAKREIGYFRDRLRPKIRFVFKPDTLPYLQHFPVQFPERLAVTMRLFRVGLRNDSSEIIKHVRVVVESVAFLVDGVASPPSTDNPVPVEHALNIMAIDSKDGMVDLAPGDRPTAYVDVAEQEIVSNRPQDSFSLCYATRYRSPLQMVGPWIITLRVEGGGTYDRQEFLISGRDDHRMEMSVHGLG